MRLYHVANSRSTRVLWTLEEIGLSYDVSVLTREERGSADHLRRHPLGRVPVIEFDDGQLMFESAAICLQLADMYPESGLIAAAGSHERAFVNQWTLFAVTEVERIVFAWNRARRRGEGEGPTAEEEQAEAFAPRGGALRQAVEGKMWIAGDDFTVADILVASMLRNAVGLGLLLTDDPLRLYVERALARPANLRAERIDSASRTE